MPLNRRFKSILAAAVLTGLVGCSDVNGLVKVPGSETGTDVLNPGNDLNNPGDQLLSNGAATAITDVVATLRDVGALKNMANPAPLLSNNASGNLISNGMAGYRIASFGTQSTDMPADDFERIAWTDSNPDPDTWPGNGTGVITGTLDGVEVERYAYTITEFTDATYKRQEVVEKSFFRPLGTYTIDGMQGFLGFDTAGRAIVEVAGTCTFTPEAGGTARTLTYQMHLHHNDAGDVERVAIDVAGVTPAGASVAMKTLYTDEVVDGTRMVSLGGEGNLTIEGRSLAFASEASKVGTAAPDGYVSLGLAEDFKLHFAFAPNQPLVATQRTADNTIVKTLETLPGTTKVVVEHTDGKKEHLDVMVLPKLYRLAIATVLPPL